MSEESIKETAELLRTGKVSSVEITKQCLARIERLNPTLNAFITVTAEAALAQARKAESEIHRGEWRGQLHGIPIALKDLIDTAGVLTTAASAIYQHRIPAEDAQVVLRLKQAGAVLVGKNNLHEFAFGGSCVVSYYGDVRNPWDTSRIAGGSSGGSGAAVAAGLCYAAIGTDTAGSIRLPAALCGVVGFKPTYGRVSARGVIPLSESLDHVGPIATTVADAAILFDAIDEGHTHKLRSESPFRTLRIGIPRKFFYEGLNPEVAVFAEDALSQLSRMGHELREINLSVPEDRTLQYGETYDHHAQFVASCSELYQPETLRRIRNGENISPGDIDRMRGELFRIRREIGTIFEEIDLMVTPTGPVPAPPIDELKSDPELLRPRELLFLRNTRPVNVWGLPAVSVPCGLTKQRLPVGLQIIGKHHEEPTVFNLALQYERARGKFPMAPELAAIIGD
jgi:aspartyl-tRNA(Asn)/glutamyl-tRNA(Gln) amidotransferase subunit A